MARLVDADAAMKKLGGECIAKYPNTFIIGLLAAVREIDNMPTIEQPTWISCAERLPELHTKVLCCGKKGGRFIAELHTWGRDNALYWTKRDGKGCPTVTHWMHLPQPPKGDE